MFDSTNKSYLNEFNNFLDQLKNLFYDNDNTKDELEIVSNILDESEELKINRGILFHKCLEENSVFDLFLNKKVNCFSSKNEHTNNLSNSLLGESLPLKKLVNKQSEKTKEIVWNYLHTFYLLNESKLEEEQRDNKRIEETLNKSVNTKEMMKKLSDKSDDNEFNSKKSEFASKILDMNLNKSTSSMIDDIINSFEDKVNSSPNQNPMESIMDITNTIASKYTEKIESGEIQLEDLLSNMKDQLPGLDQIASNFGIDPATMSSKPKKEKEVTIIDENFSTDNVELGVEDDGKKGGFNLSSGLKMLNKMQSDPQMGKMFEMLNPANLENGSPEDLINKMKESLPDDFMEKMKAGLPEEMKDKMPPDLFENMQKEMESMPDMISKMMGEEKEEEQDEQECDAEEILEPNEECENSLSLEELKEKFGLELESGGDNDKKVEQLLD